MHMQKICSTCQVPNVFFCFFLTLHHCKQSLHCAWEYIMHHIMFAETTAQTAQDEMVQKL